MVGFFYSFNMKEDEAWKGIDIEGVFMDHVVSISYGLVFTRLEKITDEDTNNKDTHVEAKVVATKSKTIVQKKKQVACNVENTW